MVLYLYLFDDSCILTDALTFRCAMLPCTTHWMDAVIEWRSQMKWKCSVLCASDLCLWWQWLWQGSKNRISKPNPARFFGVDVLLGLCVFGIVKHC